MQITGFWKSNASGVYRLLTMLGFGINQLKNYEEGQVPSESNGKMLKIVANPFTMMNLLEISSSEFKDCEYKKIKNQIALLYFDKARMSNQ